MRPESIRRGAGRVAIVGGDPLAREALAGALKGRADVAASLPFELPSHGRVTDALERADADAVVWDLGPNDHPDLLPLRAAAEAGNAIVALIAEDRQAGEVLAAGAAAVLLRESAAERLPLVLAAAASGLVVLDDALRGRLIGARHAPIDGLPTDPLTAREREVLALLAEGRSNRDIALALGIAERTAKFHVNAILEKLEAEGRTEAVVRAARLGLIVL